jgi:hypothetical protein
MGGVCRSAHPSPAQNRAAEGTVLGGLAEFDRGHEGKVDLVTSELTLQEIIRKLALPMASAAARSDMCISILVAREWSASSIR